MEWVIVGVGFVAIGVWFAANNKRVAQRYVELYRLGPDSIPYVRAVFYVLGPVLFAVGVVSIVVAATR